MATSIADTSLPTPSITTLPTAMTAAACLGIAWYLCAELNVRLLLRSTRRSLYFWSCLLCSWGLIIHLFAILLANFNIWRDYSAIVIIEFTWCTYVVSQSVVLYSRLNLVMKKDFARRCILHMIIFTGVAFGLTTVILALVARSPTMIAKLGRANLIWDRIQLAVFFVQETLISLLYIRETALHLKNMTLLGTDRKATRKVLRHLIYVNIFIIALDCSLIGLCYSGFFFLQGFYKAAIYAVKLRTEFTILNQLRSSLPGASTPESHYGSSHGRSETRPPPRNTQNRRVRGSQDSDVEMVTMADQVRGTDERILGEEVAESTSSKGGEQQVVVRTLG